MKKNIKTISYSFGVVDLFHYGHLQALKTASECGEYKVFGLLNDEVANNWMGKLVSNYEERKAVIESTSYVDAVMKQNSLDPTDNLKLLHELYPDAIITLCHGDEYSVFPAEEYLNTIGGKMKIFPYYKGITPSIIQDSINNKENTKKQYSNILSTKANTLKILSSRISKSYIEKIEIVTVKEMLTDSDAVYLRIKESFDGQRIVVRSSSKMEDGFEASNAGHFESVLNVDSFNKEATLNALRIVIESYKKDGELLLDDQVLVQTMTSDVRYSGVIFSRDIQNNRPYYVVNYSDKGDTDAVTSGQKAKTLWIAYDARNEEIKDEWKPLIQAVREIEDILKKVLLDIEFAIKSDGRVVIFQVRPLAASYRFGKVDDRDIIKLKNDTKNKYISMGNNDVFSDMAFWNPAEIIGTNPRPLDYSLYKHVITKNAWNRGLVPLGYRDVPYNLMYKFGNKPYISLRYSFESLIPGNLSDDFAEKLIVYYEKKLELTPSSHDKIEFEIVFSCFDFTTSEKLKQLEKEGFTDIEICSFEKALFDITNNTIKNYGTILNQDLSDLKKLEAQRFFTETVLADPRADERTCVDQLERLLTSLIKYGTEQFSRQARCAFIAKSLCLSLVEKEVISQSEYDIIMASVSTVAKKFNSDMAAFHKGLLTKEWLIKEYGHLRAGTYDIRNPRYADTEFYKYSSTKDEKIIDSDEIFKKSNIKAEIKNAGFEFDIDELKYFIINAIEQREYFKFIFTRSLSRSIELIAHLGGELGFERNEMSYVELPQILSLKYYDEKTEMVGFLHSIIESHKAAYKDNLNLILPECIFSACDFDFVMLNDVRPNFITNKVVNAKAVVLNEQEDLDLQNKIVIIEKADPGYDWIFSRNIAGLITKYGGVASHMAIRCAEFEIPAAIGCGDKIFQKLQTVDEITIDCKTGTIIY